MPMGNELFYIAFKNRVHGPFTFQQVRHLASTNQIVRKTQLRREGSSMWEDAENIPGLFSPVRPMELKLESPSIAPRSTSKQGMRQRGLNPPATSSIADWVKTHKQWLLIGAGVCVLLVILGMFCGNGSKDRGKIAVKPKATQKTKAAPNPVALPENATSSSEPSAAKQDLAPKSKKQSSSEKSQPEDPPFDLANVPHDPQSAFEWYLKYAKKGVAEAQFQVGRCYEDGFGTAVDFSQAFYWFCKAADQGHVLGMWNVAGCYAGGLGVEKDKKEGAKWVLKAAQGGFIEAQFTIAVMYDGGNVIEKNPKESVKWMRKVADQGWADAQLILAMDYMGGVGVEADMREAVKWMRKAANQGDMRAEGFLGAFYELGVGGLPQNDIEALRLYRKVAAHDVDALRDKIHNFEQWEAQMREMKSTTKQRVATFTNSLRELGTNEAELEETLRLAQDNPQIQFALGLVYMKLCELTNNTNEIKKAYYWMERSASNGCPEAQQVLPALRKLAL